MSSIFTPYASDETDAAGIERFDKSRAKMDAEFEPGFVTGRGLGFKGVVRDRKTDTRWRVYGAKCSLDCACAARVERTWSPEGGLSCPPTSPKR